MTFRDLLGKMSGHLEDGDLETHLLVERLCAGVESEYRQSEFDDAAFATDLFGGRHASLIPT